MNPNKRKYFKFSILVPVYKEEAVIGNTLKQLLEEVDYPDYEVIVGIDGDYDRSYEITKSFQKDHRNLLIDYDPERKGLIARMHNMLSLASGEIMVKFDADRRLGNPEKDLYRMNKYFKDPEVGAIYYSGEYDLDRLSYIYMDPRYIPELIKEREKSLISRAEIFVAILVYQFRKDYFPFTADTPIPIDTQCFRKELVTDLDPTKVHDDVWFAVNVLDKGYKIELAPDIIVFSPGGAPYDAKALWNQKIKGNVGWLQLENERNVNINSYFFGVFKVFFKNILKFRVIDIISFIYWLIIFLASYLYSFFIRDKQAKDVWKGFERKL